MQAFLLTSQTFTLVSKEPDAKNSPNGWKSMLRQLERWPVKVLITAHEQGHYFPDLNARGSAFCMCRYAEKHILDSTGNAISAVIQTVQLACPFFEALVCIPFACSRSQSLTVPPVAPARTISSALSKETHSTALWCPDRLCRMLCHQQLVDLVC